MFTGKFLIERQISVVPKIGKELMILCRDKKVWELFNILFIRKKYFPVNQPGKSIKRIFEIIFSIDNDGYRKDKDNIMSNIF